MTANFLFVCLPQAKRPSVLRCRAVQLFWDRMQIDFPVSTVTLTTEESDFHRNSTRFFPANNKTPSDLDNSFVLNHMCAVFLHFHKPWTLSVFNTHNIYKNSKLFLSYSFSNSSFLGRAIHSVYFFLTVIYCQLFFALSFVRVLLDFFVFLFNRFRIFFLAGVTPTFPTLQNVSENFNSFLCC